MGSDHHQNEEDNSENKDLSQFPEYLQKVSPSICKILMKGKSCMGFLLKLSIKDEDFFCLIFRQMLDKPAVRATITTKKPMRKSE